MYLKKILHTKFTPITRRWLVGSFVLFCATFSLLLGLYGYNIQKRVEMVRQDFINRFSSATIYAQASETTK